MHETHFVRDRQSWVGGFAACISSNHFLCRRPARIQPARLPPNHRLLRWVGPRGGNTHGSRLRRRWGPLGRWRTGECKPKSPEHSHAARVTSPPNVSAVSAILPNYKPNYIRGYERLVHGRGGKGFLFHCHCDQNQQAEEERIGDKFPRGAPPRTTFPFY